MTLVTDFFFFSSFTFYFIFVCWSWKGLIDGKERDNDNLKLNFYFWSLWLFVVKLKYFPGPVEIAVLLGRDIRGISGMILANCELSIYGTKSLRVSLCVQLTLLREGDTTDSSARGLTDSCVPTGRREKKRSCSSKSRWSRILRWSFFLTPGRPSFQVCVDCVFFLKPPGRLLFLYFSFRVYLYLYFSLFCFFNFLFNLHKCQWKSTPHFPEYQNWILTIRCSLVS